MRSAALLIFLVACDSPATGPTNTWRHVSSTPESRVAGYALSDGSHLYYLGGMTEGRPDPQPSPHLDILLVGTNRWSKGPDLPAEAPKHHLAVAQLGGRIYVVAGYDGGATFAPKATAWVLENNAWQRLKDAPVARGGATAKAIGSKIYLAGGASADDAPSIAEADAYDPATDTWTALSPLPTPRQHVASCVIENQFVVIGGLNEKREVSNVVEAYDPIANTWSRWPDLPTARGGLASVTVDDRCYVMGGETWSMPPPATFGANELYDPMSKRWAVLAPMPTARHDLGLAVVGDEIWAVGGGPTQGNSYTQAIEAYHP